MRITSVQLGNFKGFAATKAIPVKPITVFIGPNSSGKSSCIHALACLSQTAKVTNSKDALVLDDERADVHLGRFIEVVHSRDYNSVIRLGVNVSGIQIPELRNGKVRFMDGEASVDYHFKCVRRTQEIKLDQAEFKLNNDRLLIRPQGKSGTKFQISNGANTLGVSLARGSGLTFQFDYSELSKALNIPNESVQVLQIQAQVVRVLSRVKYLGPFRQSPRRRYATRGATPLEVGPEGESAVTLLANETVRQKARPHCDRVSTWINVLGLGTTIDVTRLGSSDMFDVQVGLSDGKKLPLADLGYGVSQVLPVLVQCSFAEPGDTLLFEQPEIHLHQSPSSKLAQVLCETARRGVTILLETHSPDLFKSFLSQMTAGRIPGSDVAVYDVNRHQGESILTPVPIYEDNGVYDVEYDWERNLIRTI